MQANSANSGPPASSATGQDVSAGNRFSNLTTVPLFNAAWLFAAGVALASWLWLRPSMVLIALLLTIALCGLAALCAQRIAWLPLATLWLLLGALCGGIGPHPA